MKIKAAFDSKIAQRAEEAIAHGALTNSKRPQSFVRGIYPTHLVQGHECYVWDTHFNRYIDFICGLGANLLGYAHGEVTDAIAARARKGVSLSLGTDLEVELAEQIKGLLPFVDRVRFLKTGSDACTAAIKIARAYHGVSYANEEMYGLLANKEYTRVSSRQIKAGWASNQLQGVCEEISRAAGNSRTEAIGAEAIFPDEKGTRDRSSSFWETMEPSEISRSGQGLLHGQAPANSHAVRSMWENRFAGPSLQLREAVGCALAVPDASRVRAPRPLILSDGYHGFHDAFVGLTAPHNGVIADPYILPLTGNEDLIPIAAGVIIEPVLLDASKKRRDWLTELRSACSRAGALLIFDEVITGFRFPQYTVAEWSGCIPDLILLGKAVANGMPLSIVAGKREIMECDYFVSSTFAGETLSIAAALKTIELLHKKHRIDLLWEKGQSFLDKFNELAKGVVQLEGYPTRSRFTGGEVNKALFFQESCKAGLLFGPSLFYCFPHIDVTETVLSIVKDVVIRIRSGMVELEGEMPQAPYANKVRNQ